MSDTLSATIPAPPPPPLEFDRLYRTAVGDVYAYVRAIVGDDATAQDVTATAFERAYRKRRRFDAGRGTPRQWLFAIARNAALDELRRRSRSATPIADAGDALAAPAADGDDRGDAVRAAIAGLPPRDRELVALKFHAGLSNAEIARTLGISESNTGTRLHRVLTTLRKACA